ncbi:hypothetical protein MKW92_043569 [Papaver armeniacum]|nr:hypothetical protein MKW92_043569 [Papaver armeniacum]
MVSAFDRDVGDATGWSIQAVQAKYNYTVWSMNRYFILNDTLRFAGHTSDVLEVNSDDYRLCNSKSPLATYTAGNDIVTLSKPGRRYFISGNYADCNNGLKVVIGVANFTWDEFMSRTPRQIPCSNITASYRNSEMYPLGKYPLGKFKAWR